MIKDMYKGSSTTCMMRDFILYLQEWVILGLLLLVALKLLAMHELPYPTIKIRKILLLTHLKEKMLMS